MDMNTFKDAILSSDNIVTVNARDMQLLLVKYDTLQRKVKSITDKNERLATYIEDLEFKIEKLQDTRITLDLKL